MGIVRSEGNGADPSYGPDQEPLEADDGRSRSMKKVAENNSTLPAED